jgi:hypothetical protein
MMMWLVAVGVALGGLDVVVPRSINTVGQAAAESKIAKEKQEVRKLKHKIKKIEREEKKLKHKEKKHPKLKKKVRKLEREEKKLKHKEKKLLHKIRRGG